MDALKSWPCKTLLMAVTVLLAAAVVGCGPGAKRGLEPALFPPALERRIEIAFQEAPLPEALEVVSVASGVVIIADPSLADRHGDLSNIRVSLAAKDMPVGQVLDLLLTGDLLYVPRPGYLLVTDTEGLVRSLELVLYPIADLVGAGETGDLVFGFIDIVKRNVNSMAYRDVANWTDEGGAAAIDYYPKALIVTQTPRGHELIMKLLALLRRSMPQPQRQLQE